MATYASLDASGRGELFNGLLGDLSFDPGDPTAQRQELFVRIGRARGGLAFLVRMREHLLQGVRDHRSWEAIDCDLVPVLKAHFDGGGMEFRRIDWETPATILERLMRYEAVHAIPDWRAMRRRLEADRRCYGFFHPAWPDEPIIFTEVALTRGLSANVEPILDPAFPVLDEDSSDTAVFYSITSCQIGLRGFAFGNALLCRAIEDLRARLPRVRTFATLSPIPGFRSWLSAQARARKCPLSLTALVARMGRPGWPRDAAAARELQQTLMPLCARFLLHVKQGVEPADPVARFHLSNGARLHRINWLSDVSLAGMERSAGLTANYVYRPADLEGNRHRYERDHRVLATRELERLSRQAIDVSDLGPDERLPVSA